MTLVSDYRGLLGNTQVQGIQTLFDDYVQSIIQRNGFILKYNASINLWLKAQTQSDSAAATLTALGQKAALTLNGEIPIIARAVEQSYFATANGVLETLYDTQRALLFWSLGTSPVSLDVLRQPDFPQPGLSAGLTAARDQLLDGFKDAMENFTSRAQPFGLAGVRSDPITVELTPTQLHALSTTQSIMLSIPEAYPETSRSDNVFADYCDVRLTNVRFYLDGASTANQELLVDLQQTGQETIVDSDGQAFPFSHNLVQIKFHYHMNTGHVITDGDMAGPVDDQYALVGPFALWIISVSSNNNLELDLSKVTKGYFEFSGYSRSFGSS